MVKYCGATYEELVRELSQEVFIDMELIEEYENETPSTDIDAIVNTKRTKVLKARFERKMEVLKVLVKLVKAE